MDEKIICLVRKKAIPKTPEEVVRQKMISIVADDFNIPTTNMEVEWSLSKTNAITKERADMVIYDDSNTPLAVIECKAPDIELGKTVLDQATSYADHLKVDIIYLYNGESLQAFKRTIDGFKELKSPDAPNLILNNKEIAFEEPFSWPRLEKGFQLDDALLKYAIESERISKNTPLSIILPIMKLQDMLYEQSDYLMHIHFQSNILRFIKDHNVHKRGFQVPNFRYFGFYRSMELEDHSGIFTIHIGSYVMGFDHSYLFIGISRNGVNAHILELNLDNFLVDKGNQYFALKHNLKMSKKELKECFIDNLEKFAPHISAGDLATFDNKLHSFYLNEKYSLEFLENIITYAYIRHMTKTGQQIIPLSDDEKVELFDPLELKPFEIVYFVSHREIDDLPEYLYDARGCCNVSVSNSSIEIQYNDKEDMLGATITVKGAVNQGGYDFVGSGYYNSINDHSKGFRVQSKKIKLGNSEFLFGWQEDEACNYTFILRLK